MATRRALPTILNLELPSISYACFYRSSGLAPASVPFALTHIAAPMPAQR